MELDSETTEIIIKIPLKLKNLLDEKQIDIDKVFHNALTNAIEDELIFEKEKEIIIKNQETSKIQATDIPLGHFLRVPNLNLEEYERIVNEDSWEYLDGNLIHRSPESNYHNAIVGLLYYRAKSILDSHAYLLRMSRVALNNENDRPEPDLMIFDRDSFRKKKRKDGTESEIIEASPLIVIEVVSKTSLQTDERKIEKYLSKGIREYWRIYSTVTPLKIIVCFLKKGKYECTNYTNGEVRSQTIPPFAIRIEDLMDPDTIK